MDKISTKEPGLELVFENLIEDDLYLISKSNALGQLASAVASALRESDLTVTRLVITGNLVLSVNAREDRSDNEYTMSRGAGTVAAKTMPPNADGVVDILVPSIWVFPLEDGGSLDERDRYIQHVAAREAVHASLFHDGNLPFDVYKRRGYGDALVQFAAMAGRQAEEHIAEYLSNQTSLALWSADRQQIEDSFKAWNRVLSEKFAVLSDSDPEYFSKSMMITLNALHDLWKVLSYFAAELREGDEFTSVPSEIETLSVWQDEVAPWWEEYLALLSKIPMTTPVENDLVDDVIDEVAHLLQRWAEGVGVEYQDTEEGVWFRLNRIVE